MPLLSVLLVQIDLFEANIAVFEAKLAVFDTGLNAFEANVAWDIVGVRVFEA